MLAAMGPITSHLFFPGSRPELAAKAVDSGADVACADLEDAVAPAEKNGARDAVLGMIRELGRPDVVAVRINHPATPAGRDDLAALSRLPPDARPRILVPKVSSPSEVEAVAAAFGASGERRAQGRDDGPGGQSPTPGCRLVPIIETARGLSAVEPIAGEEGVEGLLFGALDLSTELGCDRSWESLLHARSRCVVAAAVAGVPLLDTPYFDLEDDEGLEAEAVRARRLGFSGKAAIHPGQIPVIRRAFRPSAEEVEHARRVVQAAESAGGGVFLLDGSMVDAPVVEAAHRVISRARDL